MKAAKASLAKALERPDSAIRFYLFHGPDESVHPDELRRTALALALFLVELAGLDPEAVDPTAASHPDGVGS